MKDVIHLAVVNFKTTWADKEANLASMESYIHEAGQKGVEMIVFPETALTGYSNEAEVSYENKMQVVQAEPIPGPSTNRLALLAKQYNMYIILGMPEAADDTVYNSAAIIHPSGEMESYRKIHLPFDEAEWAVNGHEPKLFDTPWGPVGVTICYDTYCFPELIRYYRAKGARLMLNVTACPDAPCTSGSANLAIPAYAFVNYCFIASSNIVGKEKHNSFYGGSGVIGPVIGGTKTYVGYMFGDENSNNPELLDGIIDLSDADKYGEIPIFKRNANNECDWDYKLYKKMLEEF